ncbi:hypothetical protein SAMN05216558_4111 [Pseudomonas vancouverensis]|nr:hypothetical protein SAMN05216558_4111 [Pseudomonas vancouverensis]
MVSIVPVLISGRGAENTSNLQVAHPLKQAHGVKNMRRRFIVADLRLIK